ncbi:hypothetical protein FHS57_004792 [Runella defluvii]|uniref:Uncharacterized protein n=1 Tax=Runella defluvii TaxID=370973 RepID=A0A7W5ZNL7_9BACT|nr:hypothetical protein [Runella defluvii]MBB3840772.1 hypothetical protein [Runella defluvii]
MKNQGLTLCIITLLTMNFCVGLIPSHAQNQKISLERAQLIELTKKAEKAALYESENTSLIVQNYNLKASETNLQKELEAARNDAETFRKQRNQNRWALAGLLIAIATSIGFKIKKHIR